MTVDARVVDILAIPNRMPAGRRHRSVAVQTVQVEVGGQPLPPQFHGVVEHGVVVAKHRKAKQSVQHRQLPIAVSAAPVVDERHGRVHKHVDQSDL